MLVFQGNRKALTGPVNLLFKCATHSSCQEYDKYRCKHDVILKTLGPHTPARLSWNDQHLSVDIEEESSENTSTSPGSKSPSSASPKPILAKVKLKPC